MQVLGVSSGSSHKREREQAREQAREQQQQQREEEQRRSAADRVAYLSGCAGVSTAGTDAVRVAVHGRPVPQEESSYEPSAPYAVSDRNRLLLTDSCLLLTKRLGRTKQFQHLVAGACHVCVLSCLWCRIAAGAVFSSLPVAQTHLACCAAG
jgi:hypothetical protein